MKETRSSKLDSHLHMYRLYHTNTHICCWCHITTHTQRLCDDVYLSISCSVSHQANEQFKYAASVTVTRATEEFINI